LRKVKRVISLEFAGAARALTLGCRSTMLLLVVFLLQLLYFMLHFLIVVVIVILIIGLAAWECKLFLIDRNW